MGSPAPNFPPPQFGFAYLNKLGTALIHATQIQEPFFSLYFLVIRLMKVKPILQSRISFSTQVEHMAFFVVHVIAMTSTITNPIMYGWLNANLKHLFRAMIPHIRLATITSGHNNSGLVTNSILFC